MRSSAALLVSVLLVASSIAGVGAGNPGDEDPAHVPSALPTAAGASIGSETGTAGTSTGVSDASASHDVTRLSDEPVATSNETNGSDGSTNVTVRDGTELYVAIRENGDAHWNVTARFALHDENETTAFRELAADYENGDTRIGFGRETFERVVELARADVDRSMALQNVSRSGSVRENGSVGVLSLSFTWTNFTHVEGNRIVLGDVFWVESETWLPSLSDDQSLTIEGPPGYYVASSNIPHTGTRISYEGPRTFEYGDFSVTYAPKRTDTPTTPPSSDPSGFSALSGLIVVLFLFGMGFGAYAVSQRRGTDPDPVGESDDEGAAVTSTTADDSTEDTDASDEADEDDEPPIELLSDEERVLRLLRENDGRMKQGDIVNETNWSNAKVSQLLSKMNDDGEVDKLRIGRENLITLPDEDVTDTE